MQQVKISLFKRLYIHERGSENFTDKIYENAEEKFSDYPYRSLQNLCSNYLLNLWRK